MPTIDELDNFEKNVRLKLKQEHLLEKMEKKEDVADTVVKILRFLYENDYDKPDNLFYKLDDFF